MATLEQIERRQAGKQAKEETAASEAWKDLVLSAAAGQLDEKATLELLDSLGKTTDDLRAAVALLIGRRALLVLVSQGPATRQRIREIDEERERLGQEMEAAIVELRERQEQLAAEWHSCGVARYAQLEAERELLRTADPSLVQRVKDLELEAAELRKQLRWAETPYTASAEMGLRDEARKYATPHNLFGLRVRLRRAEQAIRKAANRRVSKEDLERAVERETRDLRKQVAAAEEAKAALIAKVADIDAERAAVEREMLEP